MEERIVERAEMKLRLDNIVIQQGRSVGRMLVLAFITLIMSPLRRHIFVCFMAKSAFLGGFFGPSYITRGRTHIVLR